jgi:hypothetical protein
VWNDSVALGYRRSTARAAPPRGSGARAYRALTPPCGRPSGAPLAKKGDLYARMIRRTRLALERGNTVLRGVLWHQGESSRIC